MLIAQLSFQPPCSPSQYAVLVEAPAIQYNIVLSKVPDKVLERCSFNTVLGTAEGYQIKCNSTAEATDVYDRLKDIYNTIILLGY